MTALAIIEERLQPAGSEAVLEELKVLFAVFEVRRDTKGETESATVGYVMTLQKYPRWALHAAIERFLDGTVPKQSTKYAPRPPELGEVIRQIIAPVQAEAHKARHRARHNPDPTPTLISAEERARVALKMAVNKQVGLERTAELIQLGSLPAWIAEAEALGIAIPEELR